MEAWSDLPVREPFRVKFYLDTNILAYLVDNTYSGLTQMMEYLKESDFVDLVSSRYVIFEFVGIRKKEHYLQKVLAKSTSADGKVNLSSLLKYKDKFTTQEVKFEDVQEDIKTAVEAEVEAIANDYGIDYSTNLLHDGLLHPTFDINLSSRISKEDCLVLTSAIWSDADTKEDFILIASNDQDFYNSYDLERLSPVFQKHELKAPIIEYFSDVKLIDGTKVNLTDANDDAKLESFLPEKLKELIALKNKGFFLGKTIQCGNGAGFPNNVVCFTLNSNTPLNNNIYLTIIGKDLDFIYYTKLPVSSFWNQTEITAYPFQRETGINVSFRPMANNPEGVPQPLEAPIIDKLREAGNLIFINPDGLE